MHSIRLRFMLLLSALLALLLLLLNSYPAILARDAVFQEKQHALNSRAVVLSGALSGLERISPDGVEAVLAFLDLSDFDRVAVLDRTGAAVFDSAADGPVPEDARTALQGRVIFRSHFANAAFLSSISMPISDGGELDGAVFLQERDEAHADAIHTMQTHLRTFSLLVSAAALLSGSLFVRRITGRLRALAGSMHTVADGNYRQRHPVRGRDEISQLCAEFNTLTACLERTESERRRFVADASHELKTPLASIRLLSDSITQSSGMDRETMREFVSDIREEAVRLQRTTEKLLTLSRLDGPVACAAAPLDLAETAREALESLRAYAREKEVTLATSLEPGCRVLGSREDMEHILYNLVDNAVKYNTPGGSVFVSLRSLGAEVELRVEDTGIGIPEAELPYVFERFYRVDKARSREAGGSGLGLSIVHDAVLAQGGSIMVEKNSPKGTRFTLRFPKL